MRIKCCNKDTVLSLDQNEWLGAGCRIPGPRSILSSSVVNVKSMLMCDGYRDPNVFWFKVETITVSGLYRTIICKGAAKLTSGNELANYLFSRNKLG